MLNLTEVNATIGSVFLNGLVSYYVHTLPELSIHLQRSSHRFDSQKDLLVPDYASWYYFSGGRAEKATSVVNNSYTRGWVNFEKDLSASGNRIELMLGTSNQEFLQEYSHWAANLENNLIIEPFRIFTDQKYKSEQKLISVFARGGYSFAGKYFVNYSFRQDGTSRLSEDNRYTGYHSIAGAWVVSNENIWPEKTLVTDVRLSGGFGQSGKIPGELPNNVSLDFNFKLPT